MGSGLSMTSVNKIKELAEAREYSLALEIIDSQDLTKSLNPQFVRLCGDVYIANGRYDDARKTLIMAHKMAPEAKRVIYSLVELYLRMGYKHLAEFYFNLYMFDAEPNFPQTNHMNYIYNKAQGCPLEEIETLLFPVYSDMMDYDWSFELYLLMKLQGKEAEARYIAEDYSATYKNEPNIAIIDEIESAQDPRDRVKQLFYIYAKDEVEDDQEELEELRQEEQLLMEADSLRMNPKEAEIQIMFDDNEKVTLGAKLKYKKHLREQEKLAKKTEQEAEYENEEVSSDEAMDLEDRSLDDSVTVDTTEEQLVNTETDAEASDSNVSAEQAEDIAEDKTNIFKKLFSKLRKEESEEGESDSEGQQAEKIVDEGEELPEETSEKTEESVETDNYEESVDVTQSEASESENHSKEVETETWNNADEIVQDEESEDFNPTVGDSVMQEIYGKKKISIKTELGENSFTDNPEDGFSKIVHDTGNPFDELYSFDKKAEEETKYADIEVEETEEVEKSSSFTFEEVQLEPEDLDQYEVDDFSGDSFEFDFDEPKSEMEAEPTEMENGYDHSEEVGYEATETVDTAEYEAAETIVNEYVEVDNEETQWPDTDTVETEDTEFVVEKIENMYTEDTEDVYEVSDEAVDVQLDIQDEILDSELADEDELENDVEEEATYGEAIISTISSAVDSMKNESVYESIKNNNGYEYPEFKTTLFPEYGKDVVEVENNFNEIMTKAQDKINENLMKEEQMQREAEALLASLGIDLGSISSGTKPEPRMNISKGSVGVSASNGAVADTSVEKEYISDVFESTADQTNYSPSRDELKASLKIDSVKKSILKHIKEYR